jgi:hypothetical protein
MTLSAAFTLELLFTRLLSRRRRTVNLAVEVDRMRISGFMNGAKVFRTRVEIRAAGKSRVLLVVTDIDYLNNDLIKKLSI